MKNERLDSLSKTLMKWRILKLDRNPSSISWFGSWYSNLFLCSKIVEHNRCKAYVFQYYLQLKRTGDPQQLGCHEWNRVADMNQHGSAVIWLAECWFRGKKVNLHLKIIKMSLLGTVIFIFFWTRTIRTCLTAWNDFKWVKNQKKNPNYFTSSFWSKLLYIVWALESGSKPFKKIKKKSRSAGNEGGSATLEWVM